MALGFRGMHTSVKGDVFWRFWLLTLCRRLWVTRTRASTCVNIQAPTQTHMRHIVQIYIYIYPGRLEALDSADPLKSSTYLPRPHILVNSASGK